MFEIRVASSFSKTIFRFPRSNFSGPVFFSGLGPGLVGQDFVCLGIEFVEGPIGKQCDKVFG